MKKIIIGIFAIAIVLYVTLFYNSEEETLMDDQLQKVENNQGDSISEKEQNTEVVPEVSQEQNLIRTDSQGSIGVGIRFDNVIEDDNENLVFSVMLNNHVMDLNDIQLDQVALLKNNDDVLVKEGFTWELIGPGGHHVSGILRVPKEYKGKDIISDTTTFIELEIKDVGDIPSRTFRWGEDVLKLYQDR